MNRNNTTTTQAKHKFHSSYSLISLFKMLLKCGFVTSLCGGLLVLVYYLGQYTIKSDVWLYQKIDIYGDLQRIPLDKINTLINLPNQQNVFTFDLEDYQKQWLKDPWVSEVRIERDWSRNLAVYVQTRKPFARWGLLQMIDTEGNVFTPPNIPEGNWIYLEGDTRYAKFLMSKINKLQSALKEINLKADTFSINERRSLSITLTNGIQVFFGEKHYEKRLSRFTLLYPLYFREKQDQIKSIDLRYSSGVAVKWFKID